MPSHERHIEQFQYSLKREINELYITVAIRTFAVGMIAIFEPVFLFLYFEHSIPSTFLFYAATIVGFVVFLPISAKTLEKLGVKKMMALGGPFLAVYLFLLSRLQDEHSSALLLCALAARIIYLVFYWLPRHIDFARFTQKSKRGRQLSTANVITALSGIVAPFIGGLMIVWFGFDTLFILSSLLLLFSTLPLFFSAEVYEKFTLSWRQSYASIFSKKHWRTTTAFFFEGIEYSAGIFLLPIFIYLMLDNFNTIGWVTSTSLLFSLVTYYLIGFVADKKGSKKIISYSSVVHAFSWIINSFIATPLQYLLYMSFFRVAEAANHLPLTTVFYQRASARRHGIDEYIVFHELAHNIGRLVFVLLVILGFSLGHESMLVYFSLAALGAFLFRLMK